MVGTDYAYTMPMCGTKGPIDIDGAFWDVPGSAPEFDSLPGIFRLTSPSTATFTTRDGRSVELVRRSGPKRFVICS